MARIRSVHPDICLDEVLADASASAERTFVRLWTHLDDEGRCVDNPKLIKAALYPLHDSVTPASVNEDLDELVRLGLLIRYEAEGKRCISAKPAAWADRQRPRHPSPSKLPAPSSTGTPPADSDTPTAVRRSPPAVGVEVVVGGEVVGEPPLVHAEPTEGSTTTEPTVSPPATGEVEQVFNAWREATGRKRSVLDPKRRKLITAALKHHSIEDLVDAVRGWRHSPHHRGENPHKTVYNDLELILRDSQHIERFRDLERQHPALVAVPASSTPHQRSQAALAAVARAIGATS